MKPELWGPHAWFLLHSISLEYPDTPTQQDKINMVNFINSLGNVLPCDKCKVNFQTHLQLRPLTDQDLSSKAAFVKWMVDIHNDVNKSNNKPTLSYEECIEHFDIVYGENNNKKLMLYLFIFMILLIIIFLFGYKIYQNMA